MNKDAFTKTINNDIEWFKKTIPLEEQNKLEAKHIISCLEYMKDHYSIVF